MIKVLIIGVNHNDPLGRMKIVDVLNNEKNTGMVPECVCVEWKKEIADEVISQRLIFIDYIQECCSSIDSGTAKQLSNAMAFEVDAHTMVYPNLEVFWLDEARNVTTSDDVVKLYYKNRADIYVTYLENDIAEMSKKLCAIRTTPVPEIRDRQFAEVVNKAIELGYKSICCIVGANHASILTEGSFADLLVNKGFEVIVYDTTV